MSLNFPTTAASNVNESEADFKALIHGLFNLAMYSESQNLQYVASWRAWFCMSFILNLEEVLDLTCFLYCHF